MKVTAPVLIESIRKLKRGDRLTIRGSRLAKGGVRFTIGN
jgi:hypothetical protein